MQPADPSTSARFDDAALDARLRAASARAPMGGDADDAAHVDDGVLLALVAGRLTDDAAVGVEAHLVSCADCRDLLAELARPVPEASLSAALGAFPTAPPAASSRRYVARIIGVVGVLAAAVLLAVGVGGPKSHPDFDWVAGYRAEALVGGVQGVRTAAERLPESRDFLPDSDVRWVIRAQDTTPAAAASVFVGPAGGALRRVEAALELGTDGTLALRALGADLLGPEPGEKLLVVAVGREPIDLGGLTFDDLDTAVKPADGAIFHKVVTYSLRSPSQQ